MTGTPAVTTSGRRPSLPGRADAVVGAASERTERVAVPGSGRTTAAGAAERCTAY
ncbi:hypothetical protein [Streptomyces sp. NPDC086010]|uniref:hypothetical protein n=1 Tax=Streptomyces sp. NPDC086010 TaxID=3365745 RepID=UPI0037D59FAE